MNHHNEREFDLAERELRNMVSNSKLFPFPSNAANSDWFRPYHDDDDRNLKTGVMANNSQQHQQHQQQQRRWSNPIQFHSTSTELFQHSHDLQKRRWSNSGLVYQQPQTRDDDNAVELSPQLSPRLSFSVNDASVTGPQSSPPRSINTADDEMNESCHYSNRVTSVEELCIDVGTVLGTGGFCVVRLARLKRNRTMKNVNSHDDHAPSPSSSSSSLQRSGMFAMKYLSPTKFAPETYEVIQWDDDILQTRRNNMFERGIADLAMEARFLSILSHEYIIRLHHVGAGCLSNQFNCNRRKEERSDHYEKTKCILGGGVDNNTNYLHRFGFFLLLDPLHETLTTRIKRTYIPQVFDQPIVDENVVPYPIRRRRLNLSCLFTCKPSPWTIGKTAKLTDKDNHTRIDPIMHQWRLQLAQRLVVIKCIALALSYLHDNCRTVFRDLKPDNIGFYRRYRSGPCNCGAAKISIQQQQQQQYRKDMFMCTCCYDEVPKLFDFGLCKELKPTLLQHHPDYNRNDCNNATYKLTGKSGTRLYMAPEVALSMPYNEKVDVYSIGVVLYHVASLVSPFSGLSVAAHERLVIRDGIRPSLVMPNSWRVRYLLKSESGASRRCHTTYEQWATRSDDAMKKHQLKLRTKCAWNVELQRLIGDCWQADMRLRPRMCDVVKRLECCIQDLTSTA
jgi:serine/threonine protein kinase